MKRKLAKRVLALLMVPAMCMSLAATASADTWAYKDHSKVADNQPLFIGHRIIDLKNWSPETDPYSDLMRAEVPLQENIDPYAATQANPELGSDVQVMYMAGDYGNSFNQGTAYNNQFSENMFNFWQYVDYYCSWHGAAVADTPLSIWDGYNEQQDTTGNGWSTQRNFEFGAINMPNPAYTNAAHKNGVLSMGCVYFDPNNRPGQPVHPLFEQDEEGNFIIAEKLVEFAKWYGFDGYFFNQEEAIDAEDVPLYKEFIQQVREAGLYCQMYDSLNENGSINAWTSTLDRDTYDLVNDPEIGRVNDSVFISYDWSAGNKMATSLANIEAWGVNPYEEVFFGVEGNQGKMSSNGHNSTYNFAEYMYKEGTKDLVGSVALFTPDGFIHDNIEDAIHDTENPNNREQDEYQWMVFERERMYFSGAYSDPTDTGEKPGASREDLGLSDVGGWVGVADFKSENSVADGSTFYTDFNTGHGLSYYVDGEVANEEEWGNMNLQAILPTWQWWIDTEEGAQKLNADFDYGPDYEKWDLDGNPMDIGYEQIGAYKGGSSLVLYGALDGENVMHLYKTDLDVTENSTLDITYNKPNTDASSMSVVLTFKDGLVDTLPVQNVGIATDGYVTTTLNLDAYAGRSIAAISLCFDTTIPVDNYQMNIGAIALKDGASHTPATPENVTIENAYNTNELVVSWDLDDYENVQEYNVYATYEDGSKEMLGGLYGSKYYIKSVDDGLTGIEVVAVGADGSESEPARVDFTYSDKVQNLTVDEAMTSTEFYSQAVNAGEITAHFEAPANADFDSYLLEVTMDYSDNDTVYTATADKDATSATVKVPLNEGDYTLSVYTVKDGVKGQAVNYGGMLKDTYSAPYDGKLELINNGRTIFLDSPTSTDWWKISVKYNGEELSIPNKYSVRNTSGVKGVARLNAITAPASSGVLEVTLTDYSGNVSEVSYVPFGDEALPDTTLLQKIYDYAVEQDTSNLIDSVKEFYDNALADAKRVLDKVYPGAEEVQTAEDNLFEAVWSLGFIRGDKTTLGILIERANSMDADKYVEANWQQLVDALADAEAVYNDGDAMDSDIQPVAENLLNAIMAQRYKADKSILEEIINKANDVDTAQYTAESVQVFTAALKAANAVLEDANLSVDDQTVVDDAVATLDDAMNGLVKLSADDNNNNSGDNNTTDEPSKDDADKNDNNSSSNSDKDDTSSKDDPNKGPMDDNKNPATGDNNLIALGALAVLLTSAGAFVVIRRKSRA